MKYPTLWKIAAFVVCQACLSPAFGAAAKGSSGKAYTVKSGDTVAKIARENKVSVATLMKANGLKSDAKIRSGQKISIPGGGTSSSAKASSQTSKTTAKSTTGSKSTTASTKTTKGKSTTAATTSNKAGKKESSSSSRGRDNTVVNITPPARTGTYTVQSGDTLNRIQRRTGTPLATLMKLNGLKESAVLRPGQTIRLSSGSSTAVAKNKPAATPPPATARPDTTDAVARVETPAVKAPAAVLVPPGTDRTAPAAAASAPASTTAPHKVENGETFASIGRLYGVTQSKLIAANPGVSPAKLKAGQTLMIPGQPVRPGAQPVVVRADGRILANRTDPLAGGVPVAAPQERPRTGYLVEEGETLSQIAQRFHTSERELRQMNRLGESDNIYAGRYILVPFIRQAPAGNSYARSDS